MKSKWIDVSAALPPFKDAGGWLPESDRVIVVTASGFRCTAYVRQDEDFPPQWIQCGRDGYTMDDVVAWMPLPPYP